MGVLCKQEPEEVFRYFEEICAIPHGSGNVEKISNYIAEFAESHGFKYRQDDKYNVIVWKDGSKGYERSEPVMLQGHIDMVAVKTQDCTKDLELEGIDIEVKDDFINAKGTTLGADNGIAVAYALAVLAGDMIAHPPLEVIFTVDERWE